MAQQRSGGGKERDAIGSSSRIFAKDGWSMFMAAYRLKVRKFKRGTALLTSQEIAQ